MQTMDVLLLVVNSQQIPVYSFCLVQRIPRCDTRAFISHAFSFSDWQNTVRRHDAAATLITIEVGAITV